jgi:hypothetical protein
MERAEAGRGGREKWLIDCIGGKWFRYLFFGFWDIWYLGMKTCEELSFASRHFLIKLSV